MKSKARGAYLAHQHVTAIRPSKAWHMLDWKELWAYLELLWVLTARDIKVRLITARFDLVICGQWPRCKARVAVAAGKLNPAAGKPEYSLRRHP